MSAKNTFDRGLGRCGLIGTGEWLLVDKFE
jgi:hypothetical protein